MKNTVFAIFLLIAFCFTVHPVLAIGSLPRQFPDKLFPQDSISLLPEKPASYNPELFAWNDPSRKKKKPFLAAIEVVGLNMVVWGFDRFVMDADFSEISIHTIRHNIKNGFVWDNDQFSTNLFSHPYHGNLYFNIARSNGMNFWQSIPYAFGGSLMWEAAMENEPPSINDFIATPIGGTALGEVTYRLSNLLLDDSRQGMARFWRELAAGTINPMQGLNRLFSGDAWKVRNKYYRYHDFNDIPVKFSVELSDRYLADNNYLFRGCNGLYMDFDVKYGDLLDEDSNKPYDFFYFHAGFNLAGNQPLFNDISLIAKIAGRRLEPLPGHHMLVGLFQHFDYHDSNPVINEYEQPPFKIAEAAALGAGMIYELPTLNDRIRIRQSTYANAILLGGSISDYYNVIDRNYNMGSGFSLKGHTEIKVRNIADLNINIEHYRIFTWEGKSPEELCGENPVYYNVQGDQGNTAFTIINPSVGIYLLPELKFQAVLSYYLRSTHYKYYEDVKFNTFETRLGLVYEF